MAALAKIALVLIVLAALTWRKLPVGLVLMISAVWLSLLFRMTAGKIVLETARCLVALDTLELAALLLLVTMFGHVLKQVEKIDGMMAALQDLIPSVRLNLVLAPAAIGLLPMPGGALLSAPMVGRIAERNNIDLAPERATVVNYWFRHIWEYSFPLYPVVVLLAHLLDVRVRTVAIVNFPLALFSVTVGALFYYRKLPVVQQVRTTAGNRFTDLKQLLQNFWPVVLVVGAAVGFNIPLIACLAVTSVLLVAMYRLPTDKILRVVKATFSLELVLLVFGVAIFKRAVEQSGCVPATLDAFQQLGFPAPVLLFGIPFIVAFMTGLAVSYVGVAVPILLPLLVGDVAGARAIDLSRMMLLFAGGYYGLLLSPVHLCLILTKQYFGAELGRVYRMLVPGVAVLAVLAVVYFVVLNCANI